MTILRCQRNPSGGSRGGGTSMLVGESLFKIVQRCPAQLLRHTREVVRTGPMLYGEGWIPTQITREPRRLWVSEVELLGKCADGSTMSFKLGPRAGPPTKATGTTGSSRPATTCRWPSTSHRRQTSRFRTIARPRDA